VRSGESSVLIGAHDSNCPGAALDINLPLSKSSRSRILEQTESRRLACGKKSAAGSIRSWSVTVTQSVIRARQIDGDAINLCGLTVLKGARKDSNTSVRTSSGPICKRMTVASTANEYYPCIQFASHFTAAGNPATCKAEETTDTNDREAEMVANAVALEQYGLDHCLYSSVLRQPVKPHFRHEQYC
jgi:hypothetical protein